MSSGKSDFYSQTLLNKLFNGAAWTVPTVLYLAAFTVTPTHNTAGTEASGGAYARVSITSNSTNWPVISSGQVITNGAAFTWAQATADWSSGVNITGLALLDSLTSGGSNNLYYFGDVTVPKNVKNGDTASVALGAMTVQEV
jgi:hypothetical protein